MEDPIVISCPWCGESFTSFFDYSAGSISYVEDCQVCCRPIVCHFTLDESGGLQIRVERE